MPFSLLGLSPALLQAIKEQNYTVPYPIQQSAIPAILKGKDILGIAQTGSGKTASFVLPMLEKLSKQTAPAKNRHVKTLVLVPTRELAVQVNAAFDVLSKHLPLRIKSLAVFGGCFY